MEVDHELIDLAKSDVPGVSGPMVASPGPFPIPNGSHGFPVSTTTKQRTSSTNTERPSLPLTHSSKESESDADDETEDATTETDSDDELVKFCKIFPEKKMWIMDMLREKLNSRAEDLVRQAQGQSDQAAH